MTIPTTSAHAAAGLLSILFHAGAALVIGGHGSVSSGVSTRVTRPDPLEFDIDVVAQVQATGRPERMTGTGTHTHPYPVAANHDSTPHDPTLVHLPVSRQHAPAQDERVETLIVETVSSEVAASPPPRFVMTLGRSEVPIHGSTLLTGVAAKSTESEGAFEDTGVDEKAALLSSAATRYPAAARASEVEADVAVEIVVDASGHVSRARTLGHAGYGLDEAAAEAVRAYRFKPAKRGGHAVPVRMNWTVIFRLN